MTTTTPCDAYRAAEARYGSGRHPRNSDKRHAFKAAYREAFDAAGWVWNVTNWNATGHASGYVSRPIA